MNNDVLWVTVPIKIQDDVLNAESVECPYDTSKIIDRCAAHKSLRNHGYRFRSRVKWGRVVWLLFHSVQHLRSISFVVSSLTLLGNSVVW